MSTGTRISSLVRDRFREEIREVIEDARYLLKNRTLTFFHDVVVPLTRNHELLQRGFISSCKKSFAKRLFGKIALASLRRSFGVNRFPGAYLGLK